VPQLKQPGHLSGKYGTWWFWYPLSTLHTSQACIPMTSQMALAVHCSRFTNGWKHGKMVQSQKEDSYRHCWQMLTTFPLNLLMMGMPGIKDSLNTVDKKCVRNILMENCSINCLMVVNHKMQQIIMPQYVRWNPIKVLLSLAKLCVGTVQCHNYIIWLNNTASIMQCIQWQSIKIFEWIIPCNQKD
jgi:hypothetical protein